MVPERQVYGHWLERPLDARMPTWQLLKARQGVGKGTRDTTERRALRVDKRDRAGRMDDYWPTTAATRAFPP